MGHSAAPGNLRHQPRHGHRALSSSRRAKQHHKTTAQRPAPPTVDGKQLHAAVVNEHAVRAAAGLTLVMGAVTFSLALFEARYLPLQVASVVLFVEFLVRVTAGFRYSPVGVVAHRMTRRMPPDWVSAKPKLFAWKLGMALSGSMMIITNSGIRGLLPRTICIICMTLMWMEASLGLCLGCEIHGRLVRRGLVAKDPDFEICGHGACELPARTDADAVPGLLGTGLAPLA